MLNKTSAYICQKLILQVDEWVEQNIRPLQEKTEKLLQVVDKLTARNTWPRRPIPWENDLKIPGKNFNRIRKHLVQSAMTRQYLQIYDDFSWTKQAISERLLLLFCDFKYT